MARSSASQRCTGQIVKSRASVESFRGSYTLRIQNIIEYTPLVHYPQFLRFNIHLGRESSCTFHESARSAATRIRESPNDPSKVLGVMAGSGCTVRGQ